ncbi:hypothetical protein [Streptomyces sp. NPDC057199]|uniref:hypothetical protein n=1 Tax=Streptomyces sp. NPDC057199 TaxID=3346047 RepID=UPI00363D3B42
MRTDGQHEWRELSGRSRLSTAAGTGPYVHVDRPDLAHQGHPASHRAGHAPLVGAEELPHG